ncbi:Rhodanese-like protein [Thalassoporum mexicanum PCC 7367]|uniref:rhodanese-like domain-containing protein n=1 Tax=Thalassoporum mexicanum TaxID=3457544 RepID=UPI00029FA2C0|nr:rhodanese-like domain-containing protein [Pseudanabaena sp. PCC 7367]AFY68556.1 Rhodanese-like protein [Pseudanabaena sp. PCC 7367]
MTKTISRQQIKSLLDDHAELTLVEALPLKYYRKHHLPGAINLPHDQTQELAPELLPDHDALIVVYCANGACTNSGIAAAALTNLGYTNVAEYVEGKQDWLEAGLPLESGR